ncbi:hypothetical protein [Micavibrio aeruginosavorus]|uniref:Uncharacterized protein n=1 Tax=Micavibrio aeruginosavorus EPB TaxID=349215 RepID=M4VJI0_9BACT|nr:hypothetical protein [Micavibrio aeruginosavorus]AGH98645.1 hypothetical protein A11S_1843 [Micavibrio aeruginosavorus EPB]
MDFKSFDWRSLQKYMKPQASEDLNRFLENLPQTAGQNALIAAGIAWAAAGALGLYATIQTQKMITLRAELKQVEALKPMVPKVTDVPVPAADVKSFAENLAQIYRGLKIQASGSSIQVSSTDTSRFAEFREAIGHMQNGGTGWRVTVDRMCVGRECDKDKLIALLKVNKVSVDKPK